MTLVQKANIESSGASEGAHSVITAQSRDNYSVMGNAGRAPANQVCQSVSVSFHTNYLS